MTRRSCRIVVFGVPADLGAEALSATLPAVATAHGRPPCAADLPLEITP